MTQSALLKRLNQTVKDKYDEVPPLYYKHSISREWLKDTIMHDYAEKYGKLEKPATQLISTLTC